MFFYTRRKHNLERKHKLLYNLQTSYAARWFSCTVFLSLQVTCSCLLVLSMHWMIHMLLYVTRSSCLLYVTHSSCLLYVTCYCRFTCTSTRQVSVQHERTTHTSQYNTREQQKNTHNFINMSHANTNSTSSIKQRERAKEEHIQFHANTDSIN